MPISGRAATRIIETMVKVPKCKLSVDQKDVRNLRQSEGKLRSSYPSKNV